ncbi:MAG: class I SAM-dependent RNA methyltransferase [Mycoplasmataceae bacterium]|nr:class I SAM-dependent RNA methyltransferase [Mycoplasmataceae bacterium]
MTVTIEKYNQNGEGVAFLNNKPIYIFGGIKGEELEIAITTEKEKYSIGKIVKIIQPSINRRLEIIKDANLIGGYELIHMNREEQLNFKKERVLNDFANIAKTELKTLDVFVGKKEFYYRNKITLHDGYFYQKQTKDKIKIDDYKLSSIKYDENLQGEIIYRQLDTLISGTKKSNISTTDSMFGLKFNVGIGSFYQINKEVAEEAYKDIKKFVIPNGKTLDLYSGIGTIAIYVSDISESVVAVENNKDSYKNAVDNIVQNQITNTRFIKADVDIFLKKNNSHFNTFIVDPPREGMSVKAIKILILKFKPERIIYLSCNPGTQASDFAKLKRHYKIIYSKIYDMFPQTKHIESLIVLEKRK